MALQEVNAGWEGTPGLLSRPCDAEYCGEEKDGDRGEEAIPKQVPGYCREGDDGAGHKVRGIHRPVRTRTETERADE